MELMQRFPQEKVERCVQAASALSRPVLEDVYKRQVKGGAEKLKVKGHLTDEGKQEQPPKVAFDAVSYTHLDVYKRQGYKIEKMD